ncbi:MAG TPA: hypothetical protein VMV46_11965 [Thermoanaerobaculia bacterium]|nr:hypothetical protein [Thermoanaerobaculia bacterium]
MKSAYELALERMDAEGIGRPRHDSLDDATRERMAEVRSKAEARLAELEIVEKKKLAAIRDPAARGEAEQHYRAERRRIEEARDRDVERLRRQAAGISSES